MIVPQISQYPVPNHPIPQSPYMYISQFLSMDAKLLQIIDANLNRLREGLRVCEDIARFIAEDKKTAELLKRLRHGATKILLHSKKFSFEQLLSARDTQKDALKFLDYKRQKSPDIADIFMANIERVKESLRVIEECFKAIDNDMSKKYRRLRFDAYEIEKRSIEKIRHI
jgi:thiamine-phosphate pyrophosphorylase